MTVSNFIINNIGAIIILVAAVIGLGKALISKNKQKLFANLYTLISEAQQLANATNPDKFKYVLDRAYDVIPLWVKFFISEDEVKMGIVYALSKVKDFAKAKAQEVTLNTNVPSPVSIATETIQNTAEQI